MGGKSHGKSTLLRALELGVYNHIPGDGKELAVTAHDAVGIRTEEGRRIERVDISPLIANITKLNETGSLCSEYASTLESQAANMMEDGEGLLEGTGFVDLTLGEAEQYCDR